MFTSTFLLSLSVLLAYGSSFLFKVLHHSVQKNKIITQAKVQYLPWLARMKNSRLHFSSNVPPPPRSTLIDTELQSLNLEITELKNNIKAIELLLVAGNGIVNVADPDLLTAVETYRAMYSNLDNGSRVKALVNKENALRRKESELRQEMKDLRHEKLLLLQKETTLEQKNTSVTRGESQDYNLFNPLYLY